MMLLKKITNKTIGLDGDKILKATLAKEGHVVPLQRIIGRATKAESKLSDYGPYTLFTGMFESVNMLTGEPFKSGLLILQGPCEGILEGMVGIATQNEQGGEVPFIFEVGAKYNPDAIAKYEFTGQILGEAALQLEDPLQKLREVAYGAKPEVSKLDAPKGGAKKETAAAGAKS